MMSAGVFLAQTAINRHAAPFNHAKSDVNDLKVTIGCQVFLARFEKTRSPKTVARFSALLPYKQKIIHVRRSGEACWVPLGTMDFGVGFEDSTSFPKPGDMLLYPGGISETELLLAYGPTRFASKAGQLAGNHFLTIRDDLDRLAEVGRQILWAGAQDILFESLRS